MKKALLSIFVLSLSTGCSSSPSISILGAFFPGWLLCVTGGLFITLIIRAALIKQGHAASLGPPVLAYPLLTAIAAIVLWIIFFKN